MIVSCAVYGSKTFGMYSASGSSARTVDDGLDTPRCGRRGADGCQIKHPTHDRGHKHMRDGRCCSSGVWGYHPIVSRNGQQMRNHDVTESDSGTAANSYCGMFRF